MLEVRGIERIRKKRRTESGRLIERKRKETRNGRFKEIKGLCEAPTIKTQKAFGEDNMWKDAPVAKDLI